MKDYLGYENARNKKNEEMYVAIIRAAYGENQTVLVGHHLCFEAEGDISTETEIPSADTLLFDHEVMTKLFGEDEAIIVLQHLASVPVEARDAVFAAHWNARYIPKIQRE